MQYINNIIKFSIRIRNMSKSRFEYVKTYETEDKILPNCWIVVRVDGKGFHKFSDKHKFKKPNDLRALELMNHSAICVMREFIDIVLAYGQSDEYSFVFRKQTETYNRRGFKILSYINSLFSSSYVFYWKQHFGNIQLLYPPSFDARIVTYPSDSNLRDYLSWRQADTHINNLYNTTFWSLIQQGGLSNTQAQQELSGTLAADKNEILFTKFGINYNNEPIIFRKGTVLLRKKIKSPINNRLQKVIFPLYQDMIQNKFWATHSEILENKGIQYYELPIAEKLPELVLSQIHSEVIDSLIDPFLHHVIANSK